MGQLIDLCKPFVGTIIMNKIGYKLLAGCFFISSAITVSAGTLVQDIGGEQGFGNSIESDTWLEYQMPFRLNTSGMSYKDLIEWEWEDVTLIDSFTISKSGSMWMGDSWGGEISMLNVAPLTGIADVNCDNCGNLYIGSPNANTLALTWHEIASPIDATALNTFQVVLINRERETGNNGDFDIEYRYQDIGWLDNNSRSAINSRPMGRENQVTLLEAGGTLEAAQILVNSSNVAQQGVWRFSVRDGILTSNAADLEIGDINNPYMPIVVDEEWAFNFEAEESEIVFIDPDVAVGYDYYVDGGSNFAQVMLPTGFDDDMFEVWLFDGSDWVSQGVVTAGTVYNFGVNGVSEFRITGIDALNMVDPTSPTAFVTGVSFVGGGIHELRQVPLTEFVDVNGPIVTVSEPPIALLALFSCAFMVFTRRKSNRPTKLAI